MIVSAEWPLLALAADVQGTQTSGGIGRAERPTTRRNSNNAILSSAWCCTAQLSDLHGQTIIAVAMSMHPPIPAHSMPATTCSLPQIHAEDSPHINRRLRSTSAHNLSKPAQLRRSRSQPRRRSQCRSSSCGACEASRSSSTGRVVWQSKSPSCAIA
jgi:hypothetical protein